MLNQSVSPRVSRPTPVGPVLPPIVPSLAATSRHRPAAIPDRAALDALLDGEDAPVEWSEEDIVLLHWRLLKEIGRLADPETPLEEKFDTLRWVFTEREKDSRPFSFVNCLRVVGCSPLSPIAYCGLVDAEEIRSRIRHDVKQWLEATLTRYPEWVREAVARNPEWVELQLARNPQWINQQVRAVALQGDLFA